MEPDINAFNDLVEQIDEFKHIKRDFNDERTILRHPKLAQDGGLLFISSVITKIDPVPISFQNTSDIFHHSIETDIDGNIWVPSHMYPLNYPLKKLMRWMNIWTMQ